MGLLKPFDYTVWGGFHPSTNQKEPAMYAYSPTGSWDPDTHSTAWWSVYPNAKYYPYFHPGQDLAAQEGTPIVASEAGLVTKAGWSSAASGYAVNIDIRWNAPITRYVHGHMSKVVVSVGQKVQRGQLLGYVGKTGYATGPHSHFGLQIGSMLYNPMPFMEDGNMTNDSRILPYTTIHYATVKGGGINIRTTPDLDVGSMNLFGTSRDYLDNTKDGIYTGTTKVGALNYKFTYLGDVVNDDGTWAKVFGFSKTLYIYKTLVNIT